MSDQQAQELTPAAMIVEEVKARDLFSSQGVWCDGEWRTIKAGGTHRGATELIFSDGHEWDGLSDELFLRRSAVQQELPPAKRAMRAAYEVWAGHAWGRFSCRGDEERAFAAGYLARSVQVERPDEDVKVRVCPECGKASPPKYPDAPTYCLEHEDEQRTHRPQHVEVAARLPERPDEGPPMNFENAQVEEEPMDYSPVAARPVVSGAGRISDLEVAVAASDALIHCLKDLEHGRRRDDLLDRERDWQRTRTLVRP